MDPRRGQPNRGGERHRGSTIMYYGTICIRGDGTSCFRDNCCTNLHRQGPPGVKDSAMRGNPEYNNTVG
eukprot:9485711-Pyramimonas_sp.AAC.2